MFFFFVYINTQFIVIVIVIFDRGYINDFHFGNCSSRFGFLAIRKHLSKFINFDTFMKAENIENHL